jgi:cytochrome b pre-mRNA-processing protein 3
MMLGWWTERRALRTLGSAIYASTAAQARAPKFFAEWHVPDTVEGRFEMLALHLAVVIARLNEIGDERGAKTAQALTEAFVVDMDIVMRKVGIGDPGVPRKVKKAAGALYDRHQAYGSAIKAVKEEATALFASAIDAHMGVLKGGEQVDVKSLSEYAAGLVGHLKRQSDIDLLAGRIDFPVP